jgi:hypothetical protein
MFDIFRAHRLDDQFSIPPEDAKIVILVAACFEAGLI